MELAVLFSDIRSFTALSEEMSPSDNFAFINAYLKRMGPQIRSNQGFIDKYIGDAIMALFPGGSRDAVWGAVGMLEELRQYNVERTAKKQPPLKIGIGLHTGEAMLGTIGDATRMEGTVIGDTVNLAARIEGLTRQFGAELIVSEEVFSQIEPKDFRAKVAWRFLGQVQVKGKQSRTHIYQAIFLGTEEAEALLADIPDFEEAVQHLLSDEIDKAQKILHRLQDRHPKDQALSYLLDKASRKKKLKANV